MKKADNFDASKWLIENKITFQSRLNEEVKKGTYDLKKETDGIDYLYLYLGYDTPEGKNPNWTILTSQDGEIFSKRIKNDPFLPLLKNLPSAEQVDSDTLTVSLDDIKSIFSPREKKEKETVKINNNYVVKDEDEDFYYIDTDKALEYLSQFDNDDISAYGFINDDEGWGEFTSNIEDVEAMSDEELEDAMRQEMSYYFFSEPDGIGESFLNEINETVTKDEIVAAIKLMNSAAEAAGFQLHGKINTNPGKRFTTHAIWTIAGEQHSDSQYPSKAVYLVWSKPTGLYVSASKGGTFPISGTPQEWSDKLKWKKAF